MHASPSSFQLHFPALHGRVPADRRTTVVHRLFSRADCHGAVPSRAHTRFFARLNFVNNISVLLSRESNSGSFFTGPLHAPVPIFLDQLHFAPHSPPGINLARQG